MVQLANLVTGGRLHGAGVIIRAPDTSAAQAGRLIVARGVHLGTVIFAEVAVS